MLKVFIIISQAKFDFKVKKQISTLSSPGILLLLALSRHLPPG